MTADEYNKERKEIEKMESKLGMSINGGPVFDPHAKPKGLPRHMFRWKSANGFHGVVDAPNLEEAEELVRKGLLVPVEEYQQ